MRLFNDIAERPPTVLACLVDDSAGLVVSFLKSSLNQT